MTGRRLTSISATERFTRGWPAACLFLACTGFASGCVGGNRSRNPFPEIESAPLQSAAQTTNADSTPADTPDPTTSAQITPPGNEVQPPPQAPLGHNVEADLQTIAQMDPQAYQQLLAERAQYKPSLWPSIVRHRRSTLAYRQQLAAQEQSPPVGIPSDDPGAPAEHLLARPTPVVHPASDAPQTAVFEPVAAQQPTAYQPTDARQFVEQIGEPAHVGEAAPPAEDAYAESTSMIQQASHLAPASIAATRPGELATLGVNNLALCSEVISFGVYTQFDPPRFAAGDQVLVYAEIENYRSDATDQGYHTALGASYTILDGSGRRVDGQEFPLVNDYCRNPRHDFFVRYFVTLPERMAPGGYTLQLHVQDVKSNKRGQSSVPLEIRRETSGQGSEAKGQ